MLKFIATGLLLLNSASAAVPRPPSDGGSRVKIGKTSYDLRQPNEIAAFLSQFRSAAATSDAPERALVEIERLGRSLDSESVYKIRELWNSIQLRSRLPVPKKVDLFQLPYLYWDYTHNPVGKGRSDATNLMGIAEDLSLVDPMDSSFWKKPSAISEKDLYLAFDRKQIPRIDDQICTYGAPKTSTGSHAGFDLKCGSVTWKVKFEHLDSPTPNSEVFNTRIFWAMGFNVEANDHAPAVKVVYDRKILLEFNSRKAIRTKLTFLAVIPVYKNNIQLSVNPFTLIVKAVMKDGTEISADELKFRLLTDPTAAPNQPRIEHFKANAADFEAQISHLVFREANIQVRESTHTNVGPWDWNDREHAKRRELRGAGLLAAWLNWYDSRFDNNRVKLGKNSEIPEFLHVISDVGSGLGSARNALKNKANRPNALPWEVTRLDDGKVKFVEFEPNEDNDSFKKMTIDDARWMGRMIARLSENQIRQGLISGGYNSAETKMYLEKLISRRDKMIADLGLGSEILPLRPTPTDRKFNYTSEIDGPMTATYSRGREVTAEATRPSKIQNGIVVRY